MKTPSDASPQGSPVSSRLQEWSFWEVLVVCVALALFAQTVFFGWVYDDQMEIVLNSFVHSLGRIGEIFTTTVWTGSGMETYLYRPLALLTYALNHQLSGLEPWSYHAVNVGLHALASVLVIRVGRLWGLPVVAAGLAGLLFAVHPVHVEVVAAVFGRKDLLATVFVLTMILHHRSAISRGGWRLMVPALAFGAALLSKEVGMVGLPLVALHDWFLEPGRKKLFRNQRIPALYVAYLAVFLAYLLVRNQITGGMGIPETSVYDNPLVGAAPGVRLATALVVLARGVLLLAAPLTLSPDYSFNAIPLVQSPADPRLLGALLLLGILGFGLWVTGRKRPVVLLGALWFLVAVFPTSNLLVTVGTIFGERLLYLPSVAFCLLAGAALLVVSRRVGAVPTALGAVLVLGLFGLQTLRYSRAWTTDLTLFQWATEHVPNSTKAYHKLGEEQLREGQVGDALRSLKRALEIAPGNEFAAITMAQARGQIAERFLPAPTPGAPEGQGGNQAAPEDADILYLLGQLSAQRGEMARAGEFWRRAIEVNPAHGEALADLGALRVTQADTTGGMQLLERAVEARPSLAGPWLNLARLRLSKGDVTGAREALRQFLEVAGPGFDREIPWARRTLAELGGD